MGIEMKGCLHTSACRIREITIHRRCGVSTLPVDAILTSSPEEGSWMELDTTLSIPDVSEERGLADMVSEVQVVGIV